MRPAFVWHLEEVLDLYAEPYEARRPQVWFDERPVQLVSEVRHPLPTRPGQPARYDSEYRREGTANLFLFGQPLWGWRPVNVTARRTASDFAYQRQALIDVHFPQAEVIRLVVDNLNTHTPAALYETVASAEARRLTRKLDFHYTPKPGSWLNMAECEFAVLTTQGLARRVPDAAPLRREVTAWQERRNRAKTLINWRFAPADARVKLHRLYPAIAEQAQPPLSALEPAA